MSPHNQWIAYGKSSLAMFKQMTQASHAAFGASDNTVPAAQVQMAQMLKASLALNTEWNDMQSSLQIGALRAQIDMLHAHPGGAALRDLIGLQRQFQDGLSAQRDSMLKSVGERAHTCFDDLQNIQTKDDLTMLLAGLFNDLGSTLREHASQTLTLMNSANAASTVLTHKTLDALIDPQPATTSPPNAAN
ncbi:MAG: hypothetical protein V4754_02060 [Pseudomonadota bacterium]